MWPLIKLSYSCFFFVCIKNFALFMSISLFTLMMAYLIKDRRIPSWKKDHMMSFTKFCFSSKLKLNHQEFIPCFVFFFFYPTSVNATVIAIFWHNASFLLKWMKLMSVLKYKDFSIKVYATHSKSKVELKSNLKRNFSSASLFVVLHQLNLTDHKLVILKSDFKCKKEKEKNAEEIFIATLAFDVLQV